MKWIMLLGARDEVEWSRWLLKLLRIAVPIFLGAHFHLFVSIEHPTQSNLSDVLKFCQGVGQEHICNRWRCIFLNKNRLHSNSFPVLTLYLIFTMGWWGERKSRIWVLFEQIEIRKDLCTHKLYSVSSAEHPAQWGNAYIWPESSFLW